MQNSFKPIAVSTCESQDARHEAIWPYPGRRDTEPFLFSDPFGLRRANLPILQHEADGTVRGMGTAFHIDGWGTLLTADHVVDEARKFAHRKTMPDGSWHYTLRPNGVYPMVILGFGLALGAVPLPDEAIAHVRSIRSPARERDDPMAALTGKIEIEAACDLAVLQLAVRAANGMIATVPVRFLQWRPKVGDTVIAFGYPQLNCQPLDEAELHYIISEGMFASYGRIVEAHPDGRGGRPTPVIEVQTHWPSGMSGGPVFNDHGEVVGIVSQSLVPSGEYPGNGTATCFELLPWLSDWLPTLDVSNPGWRNGWAVLRIDTWDLEGVYKERREAEERCVSCGPGYVVRYGSHRIGSDNFVSHD